MSDSTLRQKVAGYFDEVFFLLTPDLSRELHISPTYERVFGYPVSAGVRDTWFERVHPEDRPVLAAFMNAFPALEPGGEVELPRYRVRRADGQFRHAKCRMFPIMDDTGEMVAVGGILVDETEARLAEAALQESKRELQRMAANIERVQEEERRVTAQFVHDQLGQSLALAKLRLDAFLAAHNVPRTDPEAAKVLQAIQAAIDDSRRVAYDTSPPVLYDLGLIPALEAQGELLCSEHRLEFSIETVGSFESKSQNNVLVFRILRELMLNVIKHAAAKHLRLSVQVQPPTLFIQLIDDGRGFDMATHSPNYGLASVRQRLSYLGGELTLTSTPGQGTTAAISIPLGAFL
ncbi:MAG: PAS domain-containing protein [Polyangiaceae bacterium]|nr:PAS domain-containing protein [Polyangiaceae bacterium]